MQKIILVIPCYNEADRFSPQGFFSLLKNPDIFLLFVDDGSTDNTFSLLKGLSDTSLSIGLLRLERNMGKGEAIRLGLLDALKNNPRIVGFLDADLATPPQEIQRMIAEFEARDLCVLLASRVLLLGTKIERRALRHYAGRLFATAASIVLALPVYDTQCGAKLFKNTENLKSALKDPFLTRWIFDVELLGRITIGAPSIPPTPLEKIIEFPLRNWRDIPGSKIRFRDILKSVLSLMRIHCDFARRRKLVKIK